MEAGCVLWEQIARTSNEYPIIKFLLTTEDVDMPTIKKLLEPVSVREKDLVFGPSVVHGYSELVQTTARAPTRCSRGIR
jgi:hypothetical protein